MGQTQNPKKKKKLQSKLEVKCMGRISLQQLRFVGPSQDGITTTKYSQKTLQKET
jgi:hypothetical protein